jgi:hypothetical protein
VVLIGLDGTSSRRMGGRVDRARLARLLQALDARVEATMLLPSPPLAFPGGHHTEEVA